MAVDAESILDICENLERVKGPGFLMLAATLHAANMLNLSAQSVVKMAGGDPKHAADMHDAISVFASQFVSNFRAASGASVAEVEEAMEWATQLSARCGVTVYRKPT